MPVLRLHTGGALVKYEPYNKALLKNAETGKMARKSERSSRQRRRASAVAKKSRSQTQPAKSPGERESWDGTGEVPEWVNLAIEDARDLMDSGCPTD